MLLPTKCTSPHHSQNHRNAPRTHESGDWKLNYTLVWIDLKSFDVILQHLLKNASFQSWLGAGATGANANNYTGYWKSPAFG
jgi:hypothetical protein